MRVIVSQGLLEIVFIPARKERCETWTTKTGNVLGKFKQSLSKDGKF